MRDFDELKYEYTPQEMGELRKVLVKGDESGEFKIGGGDEMPLLNLTIYRTDFSSAVLFESICKQLGIPRTVMEHINQIEIECRVFEWSARGEAG